MAVFGVLYMSEIHENFPVDVVPEGGQFALCTACRQAVIFQTLLVGVFWTVPRDATNLFPNSAFIAAS